MDEVKPKTAVIFGGSGFIGSHLSSKLLLMGYEVIIADLIPPNIQGVDFIECDVRTKILLKLAKVPEIVFNLAAIHRTPGHKADEYYECNVLGAVNVTNWCTQHGVKRILFTSSISVYGPKKEMMRESSELQPIDSYGKSKVMAERIHQRWQEEKSNERTLVICRPAVIFGAGEKGNFTRLANALRKRHFIIPGTGETIKSCGYVKDLIKSFFFVLNTSDNNIILYNFCYPELYSLNSILLAFNKVAGYPLPPKIPFSGLVIFLSRLPSPMNSLGSRLKKLLLDTKVSPTYLLQKSFSWDTDLSSGLEDWKLSSNNKNYFK